jgi:hypothetical protein
MPVDQRPEGTAAAAGFAGIHSSGVSGPKRATALPELKREETDGVQFKSPLPRLPDCFASANPAASWRSDWRRDLSFLVSMPLGNSPQ